MRRHLTGLTGLAAFAGFAIGVPFALAASKASPSLKVDRPRALSHAHYTAEAIGARSSTHGLQGLAFGPDGALYAGSITGHAIHRVDVTTGAVSTFMGPPRGGADDLAFAADGTVVWTGAEQGIVYSRGKDGKVRTLAQSLPGVNAVGFGPSGRLFVTRLYYGDGLYEVDLTGVKPPRVVAEKLGWLNAFQIASDGSLYGPLMLSGKVIKLDIETGEIHEIASGFDWPTAVKIEADGQLIVLDYYKGEVTRVDPKTGHKAVLASLPPLVDNVAIDKDGTIYVSSTAFNGITAIDPKTLAQRRVMWGLLSAPGLLTINDAEGADQLMVADLWGPRVVNTASGEVTMVKGDRTPLGAWAIVRNGSTYILSIRGFDGAGSVQVVERETGRVLLNLTNFGAPYDVKPLPDGFVVADFAVGRLTKVGNDPAHTRTTFAWNFDGPVGLADAGGGQFYVSEYTGGRITRVDTRTNAQTVIIDGLDAPEGIALTPEGQLIVAEVGEKRVISVDPLTGRATVLADHLAIGVEASPPAAAPFLPTGVAVGKGGAIYVTSDIDNIVYRLIPPKP